MQPNLLSLLLGVPASDSGSILSEGGSGGTDIFSQLLSDSQFAATQQDKGAAGVLLKAGVTPSALLAQEVGFGNARAVLDQSITPEDAEALIAKIDVLLSNGQGQPQHERLLEQLKEALEPVAEGEQAVELTEILDAVPELQAPQDDTADADTPESPLLRLLAWVQQTLEKKKEIAAQHGAEEDGVPLANLGNGLQAIMFRPDDGAAAPPASKAQEEKIVTMPTIGEPVTDAAAPIVIDIAPLSAQRAMPPEWLAAIVSGERRAVVDEVIAPLELAGEDALPVVTLPLINGDSAEDLLLVGAEAPAATKSEASTRANDWLKHLPFPLKVSDAASPHQASPEAAAADAPKLAPLPAQATARDPAQVTLPEMAQGDEHANDNARPLTLTAVTPTAYTRTAHLPTSHIPHASLVPMTPSDQVHVAIRHATDDGIDRITIQLEPAELGRVEVRMQVAHDGRTHMVISADRASTLDLLARDAHGLERSLAEAGIKADAGTMEFNLRQQPQFVNAGTGDNSGDGQAPANEEEQAHNETTPLPNTVAVSATVQHLTLDVSAGVDIQA